MANDEVNKMVDFNRDLPRHMHITIKIATTFIFIFEQTRTVRRFLFDLRISLVFFFAIASICEYTRKMKNQLEFRSKFGTFCKVPMVSQGRRGSAQLPGLVRPKRPVLEKFEICMDGKVIDIL